MDEPITAHTPDDGERARADDALTPRQRRAARRHAFWEGLSEFVLSIPPGVGIRIGG